MSNAERVRKRILNSQRESRRWTFPHVMDWRNPVEGRPLAEVVGTKANFDRFVSGQVADLKDPPRGTR